MMTLPCYRYELTVRDGEITPHEMLNGGTAGDNGALRLTFVLADAEAVGYRYRIEIVTGAGGYDTTAPLSVQNGRIEWDVPTSWTAPGVASVRLVQMDAEESVRRYFPPVAVRFAYRDEGDGTVAATPLWQELITRAERLLEQAQAAAMESATTAQVSADYAESAATHAAGVDLKAGEALALAAQAKSDISAVDIKVDDTLRQLGDIDVALDTILAIQSALMGGDGV